MKAYYTYDTILRQPIVDVRKQYSYTPWSPWELASSWFEWNDWAFDESYW